MACEMAGRDGMPGSEREVQAMMEDDNAVMLARRKADGRMNRRQGSRIVQAPEQSSFFLFRTTPCRADEESSLTNVRGLVYHSNNTYEHTLTLPPKQLLISLGKP
eukprot:scaffold78304_cov17-Prasinocladus_malaysianus.AAC.1